MNRSIRVSTLLFGAALFAGGWVALQSVSSTSSAAQGRAPSGETGRYRIAAAQPAEVYVIDTKTSQVWRHEGFVWKSMGSPAKDK